MYEYKDIRNFYFENETGKRIDCQKVNGGLFLYNVSGLGYEEDIEYKQIGNTFIENDKKMAQNQITGELEFYNMTYDEYCDFVNFILGSSELKLIYIPKKEKRTEYFRDIDVCKIDKNEEDDFNILNCPITMNCKGLWYEENKMVYTTEALDDEMRWDFKWDSKFTDYNVRTLSYINEGHVEAPILLEMSGQLINPKIELYVEGQLYQTVTINTEIHEYEKLLYGTKEDEFHISRQKTDGTLEDLYDLDIIDFENDNVIRLPKNRSCEIKLSADNDILNAQLIILVYYKAV